MVTPNASRTRLRQTNAGQTLPLLDLLASPQVKMCSNRTEIRTLDPTISSVSHKITSPAFYQLSYRDKHNLEEGKKEHTFTTEPKEWPHFEASNYVLHTQLLPPNKRNIDAMRVMGLNNKDNMNTRQLAVPNILLIWYQVSHCTSQNFDIIPLESYWVYIFPLY